MRRKGDLYAGYYVSYQFDLLIKAVNSSRGSNSIKRQLVEAKLNLRL